MITVFAMAIYILAIIPAVGVMVIVRNRNLWVSDQYGIAKIKDKKVQRIFYGLWMVAMSLFFLYWRLLK